MTQKFFERAIAILAMVLFLFFFFTWCAKAQTERNYTCGDLVRALDSNDQAVLTDTAEQADTYLNTVWPDIAANPNAVQVFSETTVGVCEDVVARQESDLPLNKVEAEVAPTIESENSF